MNDKAWRGGDLFVIMIRPSFVLITEEWVVGIVFRVFLWKTWQMMGWDGVERLMLKSHPVSDRMERRVVTWTD